MTTTTAESNGTALAVRDYPKLTELTGFSSAQINLVRQTVATGCSIVEVAWYLYNAKRLGLEPTLDQIYLIKYGNSPAEIVVGIGGYRSQAESSGTYAGSDVAEFEYEDVGQPKGAPSKATVTVWKIVAGMRVPFTAEARWEEFYPGPTKAGEQYRKRPHNQLSVRAESHALRKAFPYQTARLDIADAAPAAWVEAAQADEAHRNSPERMRALAAQHDRIYGTEDESYRIDPPVETRADQPSAPAGESVSPPSEAGSRGSVMVTSKRSSLWTDFTAARAQAEAEGLQVPALDLPQSEESLRASTAELNEAIEAKRSAQLPL